MTLYTSRRELIRSAFAIAMAGSFQQRMSAATVPPFISFPSDPRSRLSLTSYPFRGWIQSPTNHGRDNRLPAMDLKEFPTFALEKFGISNINPLVDHLGSTEPAYLDEFRASVSKAGSRIVDLGLPGGRFYDADVSVREQAVTAACRHIDIAAQLGSPSVRQHVSGTRGSVPDVDLAADSLSQLADYGGKHNVVINLENDSAVSEDPFFLVAVMNKAGNPYLRGLPDFGNSLMGHDQAFNHRAVEAMLAHVFNVCHVKNRLQMENGTQYAVDLSYMFNLAKKHSYSGFYCMEFDSRSGDPVEGTRNLVKESLEYLS